jgi:hypothetical protein
MSNRAAIAWTVILLAIIVGGFVAPAMLDGPDAGGHHLLGRWLVEVWLLVGLVAWSLHRVHVRGLLTVTQRAVAAVLVIGFVVSQLSYGRLGSYPFLTWGMYTVSQDRVPYLDLVMLDAAGEAGRLPVASFVPASDARGFLSRIDGLLREAEDGDDQADRALELTVRRLLAAHGDPTIEAVDLRRCEVSGAGVDLGTVCISARVVHR